MIYVEKTTQNFQPVIDFISGYKQITEVEMNAIIERVHFSFFEKNEVLFRQGTVPQKILFIVKGAVRWYYADEKENEHTVDFAFENQPVVPFGCFERQVPCIHSAITMEPTDVIWTSYAELFGFLKSFPKYDSTFRTIITEYLNQERKQAKLLRIHSSKERYESLYKWRPEWVQRVPLTHLASYLEMALETLSRVRGGKL